MASQIHGLKYQMCLKRRRDFDKRLPLKSSCEYKLDYEICALKYSCDKEPCKQTNVYPG